MVKLIETKSRMVVAGDRGGRNEKLLFNGDRVPVQKNGKVLEMDVVMVAQQCEYI